MWGFEPRSSHLCAKHFTDWIISLIHHLDLQCAQIHLLRELPTYFVELASGQPRFCEHFILRENKLRAAQGVIFQWGSRLQEVSLGCWRFLNCLCGGKGSDSWRHSVWPGQSLHLFNRHLSILGLTFSGWPIGSSTYPLLWFITNWPTEARAVHWDNKARPSLRSKMLGRPFSDKNLQFVFILFLVD